MNQKVKVDWKKVPSVTHGGKPYFWATTNLKEKHFVVWNRLFKQWVVMINPKTPEEEPYKEWFSTSDQAKKYVEKLGGETK